jgi:hypothetical protein
MFKVVQHSTFAFPRRWPDRNRIHIMRKLLLAVLLFQAVNAFGQTISAEISSDPLPAALSTSFAVPAIAMARDRTGVAIAWAGDGRISVGRLDATGHFTGPVRSIPTTSSPDPVAGAAPSLAAAPGGDGFILTWLELHLVNVALKQGAFCRLDAGLNPSAPALLPLAPPVNSPPIVRSGKTTTWITADRMAWRVRSDGSLDSSLFASVAATDMTVANDFPQMISSSNVRNADFICNAAQQGCTNSSREAGWVCTESCRLYSSNYELQFVSLYDVVTSYTFKFDSQSVPAVRSDGRDVLASWFVGDEARGGWVAAAHLDPARFIDFARVIPAFRVIGNVGPDSGPTRPDIATDGERYVVVWRTATTTNGSHDIAGASIDRAGTVIPFSIATSTDDERDPSVVAIGNGRFLVAYDKLSNGERRIAGRFVTFGNRTHAVR